MNKIFKRFLSIIITVFILFTVLVRGVNAANTGVTDIGSAQFYIDEVLAENHLPFGVKHTKAIGFSSAASGEVKNMGTGITESFVPGKFYQQQVNILEVPSTTDVQVTPWAYISSGNWNLATVRNIAKDYEQKNPGRKVIAAINADFFDINSQKLFPKTPSGAHASNGDYYKTLTGNAIGFTNNGTANSLIGNVVLKRSSKMTLSIYNENNEIVKEFQIDKINTEPTGNEISIFYAKWAIEAGWPAQKIVPIQVTDAYIVDNGEYALPSTNRTVSGTGATTEDFYGRGVITSFGSGELSTADFAIKTNNPEVKEALAVGVKIRAQYTFTNEFANVKDIVGVGNTILANGQRVGTDADRHPRTFIGAKADGTIVMAVVDGRQQDKKMYGLSQAEMAAVLKHFDCVQGYNLDGGGSSTMLILKDGDLEVQNSPSDGRERTDSNAILVTVAVPDIETEVIDIKNDGFTVKTTVNETSDMYKDIYVRVGNEYKLVENGKAVFTGLNPNYPYVYDLFIKEYDKYVPLVVTGKATTAKRTPTIDKVAIGYSNGEVVFNITYNDPDSAIIRKQVQLGNERKTVTGTQVIFTDFYGSILENLEISIGYDLNDGKGRQDVVPTNLSLQYGLLVYFNITNYQLMQAIRGAYK